MLSDKCINFGYLFPRYLSLYKVASPPKPTFIDIEWAFNNTSYQHGVPENITEGVMLGEIDFRNLLRMDKGSR